jgi:hypothetical protein
MTIRGRRPSAGTIFGLAALAVAVGGVAYAAIPDSGGTIHACYQKSNGNLRVVESSARCRNGESPLAWSQGGGTGALKMYVKHDASAPQQFVTLYDVPGQLRARLKCEDLPPQEPDQRLKRFTYELTNVRQDEALLFHGDYLFGANAASGTVAPGATRSFSTTADLRDLSGTFPVDFTAYWGTSDAANGHGTVSFEHPCADHGLSSETQAISNVAS